EAGDIEVRHDYCPKIKQTGRVASVDGPSAVHAGVPTAGSVTRPRPGCDRGRRTRRVRRVADADGEPLELKCDRMPPSRPSGCCRIGPTAMNPSRLRTALCLNILLPIATLSGGPSAAQRRSPARRPPP